VVESGGGKLGVLGVKGESAARLTAKPKPDFMSPGVLAGVK